MPLMPISASAPVCRGSVAIAAPLIFLRTTDASGILISPSYGVPYVTYALSAFQSIVLRQTDSCFACLHLQVKDLYR